MFATFLVAVLAITFHAASSYSEQYYTAAVYEHARLTNFSTPSDIIHGNLAYYRNAARVASSKGADIIVFPEYGIFSPANRSVLKQYLEDVPDPKEARANPCSEADRYSDRPILHTLSCIARNYSLVVVANTGDIKRCTPGDTGCPEDGDLHHNTNVAFDSDGTLVGRYHKERLFFEDGMDLPRVPQDPTFEAAGLGKFGMFVCFDSVFRRITEVARQQDVEAVLLPTMWIDPAPLMFSVQFWQSWAMGNNVTFMAANIQMPGYLAVGSGIFYGNYGPVAYTYNPDGKSKLVVAQVPRRHSGQSTPQTSSTTVITENGSEAYENDGDKVPDVCSMKVLNESTSIYTDYRCLEEDTSNYTFVKLEQAEGHLEACNRGMCCSLNYSAADMQENYYLGVYNGTYNMFDRYYWWQENCFLVRCDAFGNNSCATFPTRSKTKFRSVQLRANVTTDYVYPSVLASGIRLVPVSDWQHGIRNNTAYVSFNNSAGTDLLVVGLNGRQFSRDPPYIR